MKAILLDFGIKFEKVPLLCDNGSAAKIVSNLVQDSITKHIDIRQHFIEITKGNVNIKINSGQR